MHADQLDLTTEDARALIADQFPRYRGARVMPVASDGTVNAVYRVGDDAAARFPLRRADPVALAATLRAEAAAMSELAAAVSVAAPLPLGIGRPGAGFPLPWTLQSWVAGVVATPSGLSASAAFAGDIAALIAELRAVETAGRGFDGRGRGGALTDHDAWLELCFERSAGILDVPRLRALWSRLRDLPPSGPDVMSHRDLIPANLLVRDGRLCGVLDTGAFGPADRALDLVAAWHLFDADRRALLRQRLGCGRVEWLRGAAWALAQALGLPWYYRDSNPGMAALGLSTLQRLLDDPEVAVGA